MRLLSLLALCLLCCGALCAQTRRDSVHNPKQPDLDKQRKEAEARAKKAQNAREAEEREVEREAAKAEREAKQGAAQSKESPIKPGDTVSDEVKQAWIDAELDKLGVTSKTTRSAFSRLTLKAWKDSEAEDARYAKDFNAAKEDTSLAEAAKKTHQEKLKKIWDDHDAELKKKNWLDEERFKVYQADTKTLREKTATDKYEEIEKARAEKKSPKKKPEGEGKAPEKKDPGN